MEPKFINEFSISFDLYKEWANNPVGKSAIQKRKKGFSLRIAGCIISIAIIILGALVNEFYAILMGTAFLVIFALRLFYIPNKVLKRQYEYITKLNNGNQPKRTVVFSDNIAIEDGKSTTRYEYSEILKVTEDEKYFYLFLNVDMVLRILKDSFTLGSSEDFRSFINNAITNKVGNVEIEEEDNLGL